MKVASWDFGGEHLSEGERAVIKRLSQALEVERVEELVG
jgi:hypothetical protein